MTINTVALLRTDLDNFILRTYQEGAVLMQKHKAVSLEGNSALVSISNEGVISWAKEKIKAIGRKFVALVNKIVARFSKNREKLEANIREYEKNPNGHVVLPVSGKSIGYAIAATAAIASAIAIIVKLRKHPQGKEKIKEVWKKTSNKIKELKEKYLKRNSASEEDCTVSTKEAKDMATKYHKANTEAEKAAKDAANEFSRDGGTASPDGVTSVGEAARAAADLAEQAGQMGSHMNNKAETSSGKGDEKPRKGIFGSIFKKKEDKDSKKEEKYTNVKEDQVIVLSTSAEWVQEYGLGIESARALTRLSQFYWVGLKSQWNRMKENLKNFNHLKDIPKEKMEQVWIVYEIQSSKVEYRHRNGPKSITTNRIPFGKKSKGAIMSCMRFYSEKVPNEKGQLYTHPDMTGNIMDSGFQAE